VHIDDLFWIGQLKTDQFNATLQILRNWSVVCFLLKKYPCQRLSGYDKFITPQKGKINSSWDRSQSNLSFTSKNQVTESQEIHTTTDSERSRSREF
jgi:hypothetical protein